MATLEKPKKEKSKKSKTKSRHAEVLYDVMKEKEEEDDEVATSSNALVNADLVGRLKLEDLDKFELSSTKEIVSHECHVAAGSASHCPESRSRTEEDSQENISLHDELLQSSASEQTIATASLEPQPIVVPSAPPAKTSIATRPEIVQYPNLAPMQQVETKSAIVYQRPTTMISIASSLSGSELQPFRAEELEQYYHCPELELAKQFELEFLMNSLLETHEADPLYAALLEYYNLQSKLTMNLHDVTKSRADVLEAQERIWVEVPITKTFTGRCGDRVEVKETFTYNITHVDGKNLETASATLKHLFDLVCYTYTTNSITAKITKVKIDQILDELIGQPCAARLAKSPLLRLNQALDAELTACVAQLRRAIAIVFSFTRRLSPNAHFDSDLKQWLHKLVSLLLLAASREDHWFLLLNILRCPSGVATWATPFVQLPSSAMPQGATTPSSTSILPLSLDGPEMNLCIATLQIMLLPVKKRNDYLKEFTQSHKEISDPVKEERWILIDSDGEDSHTSTGECVGLKESDLIALLNQIPFEALFTSALGIEKFLDDYIIEVDVVSAHHMLKAIAFFAKLIELFGEGMVTYNTERYKQLAKRLGRLVRHTLQYVFDYNDLFMHNNLGKDSRICKRIAVEMNALLMRACNYIYRTRNLATWQYFSSLPFPALDADTLWQTFYYLNVGFPTALPDQHKDHRELFNAPDFWQKFNVAQADSSPEDLYYLLQAFFEMANERDRVKDSELIKTICLHIFNIGFVNEATRDVCYKTSRDMLVNLTLAYEELMSYLLLQLKVRFSDIENAAYLFKSLPLENWRPAMDSFEILSNWLLHFDFKSPENMLARIIVSHLNWGFDADGRLFLPHNIHVRMACLVTDALTRHAPELIGASTISESVRQVSHLIADLTQSTREQFATWCWSMVSVLRLHLMDQSVESIRRTLANPHEPLMFVPELERIDLIYQGVSEQRPLAVYAALLVSLHGHSVPVICQGGFDLMKQLLNDYRHAAVIRIIELIVPLFLETPDTLANCESFHVVLNTLLTADKTYLKMAKDIIYPNSIGPVLELLDNMIHHQITTYNDYGLSSPMNLINVWLTCLTALPGWQTTSVVYLLDKVLRVAYQFPDARQQAVEYFANYYKDCDEWKGVNKMSTLKTFFGSNQSRVPALSPLHGWLALVLLEIEFRAHDALLWIEFLRQLAATSDSRNNMDGILKKTASVVKMTSFPTQMLVIYKYANLVASMDISHPVFPILNQKFFELYLSRVPLNYDELSFQSVYGIAERFYETNVPLMKRIKANIRAAETYYANESTKLASDEAIGYFYRNCAKIMKTYSLWLEETSISRQTPEQFNFPPQYNTEKLLEILNGNTPHWTEFIYLPDIRKEQRYQSDQWARKCFRVKAVKHLRSPLQPKAMRTPIERIKMHLRSYDKRIAAPLYTPPSLTLQSGIDGSTMQQLKALLKTVNSMAMKFHFTTSELNSLNRNYQEIVLELYTMVPYQQVNLKSCNSLVFNRKCSDPARISATLEQIRKNDVVEGKVEKYRERHNKIIDEMIEQSVEDFARSIEQMGQILRVLIDAQMMEEKRTHVVTSTGIELFYSIIEQMTDISIQFPPTNDFYSQVLSELGIFIQENQEQQGYTILELALKRPDLLKVLSGVFVPYRTRPQYFIKMYKFLTDSYLKRCDPKILFVLLSKFDLVAWLDSFHPKLFDISQLLQLVLHGLECWQQPDSSLLQDQFRRHLVHIYNYDFPQHYGEVMQMVLDRISDQKLMPLVLLDLLNSLLQSVNCAAVDLDTTDEQWMEISVDFARRQNLFNLKAATETIMLFARHFQKERLNHGLHGLYPKHKSYCKALSMWFAAFGHLVVINAICTYQELLADQISEVIFGSIVDMYAPWLVAYTEQAIKQQPTANWIRQLTESGKQLLPWSEQHAPTSRIMIKPFIDTLIFVLDTLPVAHKILAHTFGWYVHHFTVPNIEQHIYWPVHEGLAKLPWERLQMQPTHIDMLYDSLQKFVPSAHAMLGHIFIRLQWNAWFADTLPALPQNVRVHCVSRLFSVFVQIAFEPNIHVHTNTSKILEEAINYPWHMVEYAELDRLCKWFAGTLESSIVLKMPTETNYADRAVLDLLRLSCAMMPEVTLHWRAMLQPECHGTAKRMLYTRFLVRLLRLCASKHHKLLATKDGLRAYNDAFMSLLNTMNAAISAVAEVKTPEEQKREALNLMIEIVVPMQTQSEETSNLHIDTVILWQQQQSAANLLVYSTLGAIGHMNAFIAGTYALLNASIASYFRTSDETRDQHSPTWIDLLQALQMSLDKLELMAIIRGSHLYALHIFILFKLEKMPNLGEQITFLQDLIQLTQNFKTSELTEPQLALVWGLMISRGCRMLASSELAKKPLFMLARHLHVLSTQAEGWGEGLLGAIGFKKDIVTNRRKVLTRCFACVIFSLFPERTGAVTLPNQEFNNSLHELTMLLANKRYLDVKPLVVRAVGIIKEEITPSLRDVPHLICRLISLFYNGPFLTTIPEIWDFDYRLQ